jgi:hypothetical protein
MPEKKGTRLFFKLIESLTWAEEIIELSKRIIAKVQLEKWLFLTSKWFNSWRKL